LKENGLEPEKKPKTKPSQLPLATSASFFTRLPRLLLGRDPTRSRYTIQRHAFSHGVLSIFGLVCGPTTIAADRFDNLFSREQTTLHRF